MITGVRCGGRAPFRGSRPRGRRRPIPPSITIPASLPGARAEGAHPPSSSCLSRPESSILFRTPSPASGGGQESYECRTGGGRRSISSSAPAGRPRPVSNRSALEVGPQSARQRARNLRSLPPFSGGLPAHSRTVLFAGQALASSCSVTDGRRTAARRGAEYPYSSDRDHLQVDGGRPLAYVDPFADLVLEVRSSCLEITPSPSRAPRADRGIVAARPKRRELAACDAEEEEGHVRPRAAVLDSRRVPRPLVDALERLTSSTSGTSAGFRP